VGLLALPAGISACGNTGVFERVGAAEMPITPVEAMIKEIRTSAEEVDAMAGQSFVFGVDLDGVVADFYGYLREITAEWLDVDLAELTPDVTYGLPEWGMDADEYKKLHRFAIRRGLFEKMPPIRGAPQTLRRLSRDGIVIRIITHRLYLKYSHQAAIQQTVQWLDHHSVPYWDLCFMRDKGDVGADLYIEDAPRNIADLRELGKPVIVFENSTNLDVPEGAGGRAKTWDEVEEIARGFYADWTARNGLPESVGADSE
jgi:hypothetical protein